MLADSEWPVGTARRSDAPARTAGRPAEAASAVLPHLRESAATKATPHPVLAELLSQHADIPPLLEEWAKPPPSTLAPPTKASKKQPEPDFYVRPPEGTKDR